MMQLWLIRPQKYQLHHTNAQAYAELGKLIILIEQGCQLCGKFHSRKAYSGCFQPWFHISYALFVFWGLRLYAMLICLKPLSFLVPPLCCCILLSQLLCLAFWLGRTRERGCLCMRPKTKLEHWKGYGMILQTMYERHIGLGVMSYAMSKSVRQWMVVSAWTALNDIHISHAPIAIRISYLQSWDFKVWPRIWKVSSQILILENLLLSNCKQHQCCWVVTFVRIWKTCI